MSSNFYSLVTFIFLLIMIFGCVQRQKPKAFETNEPKNAAQRNERKLPSHLQDLKNLTIYPVNVEVSDTVFLEKEKVFESNKEVFLDGYIDEIAVDDKDRVFIAVTKPGAVGIYVFNPDGSYNTRFANEGRGPGEYESIGSIEILNGYLHLWDPRLQKIGLFNTDDFSHVKDESLKKIK